MPLALLIALALTLKQSPAPAAAQAAVKSQLASGNAHLAQRDYPDAIDDFDAVLAQSPKNLEASVGLAIAYRGAHNYDRAKTNSHRRAAGASAERGATRAIGRS